MMRKPCPHNPVFPKFQREHLRRKRAEHLTFEVFMGNLTLEQQLNWMWRGAKASNRSCSVEDSFKILKQMTDPIPDRLVLANVRNLHD
jgi:hypothetical protein